MTGESEANGPPHALSDEERAEQIDALIGGMERRMALDWVGDHLPEVRRSVYGQRSLYWALGIGLIVGMAFYSGGYALKSSFTTEPLAFLGDLFYTFGWALWTGAVVVVFLQLIPQSKRRGYRQLLDAYEAERGKTGGEGHR